MTRCKIDGPLSVNSTVASLNSRFLAQHCSNSHFCLSRSLVCVFTVLILRENQRNYLKRAMNTIALAENIITFYKMAARKCIKLNNGHQINENLHCFLYISVCVDPI